MVASLGSYYQTNDDFNCGGHTERLAYYGSVNGNQSDLGLETPVAQIIHDGVYGYGGFGSLIFNVNPKNHRILRLGRAGLHHPPDARSGQIVYCFAFLGYR